MDLNINIFRPCTPISQGERTKFDRFVDPNVRGAQRQVYSDLRINRNIELFLRLQMHKINKCVPSFDKEKRNFIVRMIDHEFHAVSWLNPYNVPDLANIKNNSKSESTLLTID